MCMVVAHRIVQCARGGQCLQGSRCVRVRLRVWNVTSSVRFMRWHSCRMIDGHNADGDASADGIHQTLFLCIPPPAHVYTPLHLSYHACSSCCQAPCSSQSENLIMFMIVHLCRPQSPTHTQTQTTIPHTRAAPHTCSNCCQAPCNSRSVTNCCTLTTNCSISCIGSAASAEIWPNAAAVAMFGAKFDPEATACCSIIADIPAGRLPRCPDPADSPVGAFGR